MDQVPEPRALGRRPALDGLRALAVLGVVGQHYIARLVPGGAVGVTVFFVLSGFLITSLLLEEWDRRATVSFRRFWARRALRLLPALLLLLAVDLVVHLAIDGSAGLGRGWAAIWGPLSYVNNWLYVYGRRSNELTPLWSLAVEEQFYVVWPAVLLALLHLGLRGRALTRVVTGIALAALAWHLRWWAVGGTYARAYYGTDMRAYELLAGCALACAWRTGAFDRVSRGRLGSSLAAGSGLCLAAIAVGTHAAEVTPLGSLATLAAAVVVITMVEARGRLLRLAATPVLVRVGIMSYGIYLWNFFFLGVFGWAAPYRELDLALTFLVATLSFRLVEEPVLRLKARLSGAASTDDVVNPPAVPPSPRLGALPLVETAAAAGVQTGG